MEEFADLNMEKYDIIDDYASERMNKLSKDDINFVNLVLKDVKSKNFFFGRPFENEEKFKVKKHLIALFGSQCVDYFFFNYVCYRDNLCGRDSMTNDHFKMVVLMLGYYLQIVGDYDADIEKAEIERICLRLNPHFLKRREEILSKVQYLRSTYRENNNKLQIAIVPPEIQYVTIKIVEYSYPVEIKYLELPQGEILPWFYNIMEHQPENETFYEIGKCSRGCYQIVRYFIDMYRNNMIREKAGSEFCYHKRLSLECVECGLRMTPNPIMSMVGGIRGLRLHNILEITINDSDLLFSLRRVTGHVKHLEYLFCDTLKGLARFAYVYYKEEVGSFKKYIMCSCYYKKYYRMLRQHFLLTGFLKVNDLYNLHLEEKDYVIDDRVVRYLQYGGSLDKILWKLKRPDLAGIRYDFEEDDIAGEVCVCDGVFVYKDFPEIINLKMCFQYLRCKGIYSTVFSEQRNLLDQSKKDFGDFKEETFVGTIGNYDLGFFFKENVPIEKVEQWLRELDLVEKRKVDGASDIKKNRRRKKPNKRRNKKH